MITPNHPSVVLAVLPPAEPIPAEGGESARQMLRSATFRLEALRDLPPITDLPATCVLRGRDVLDANEPGWWRRIDPLRLRIESRHDCMLGQLYGTFFRGAAKLQIAASDAWRYGWDVDLDVDLDGLLSWEEECALLGDLWRQVISERTCADVMAARAAAREEAPGE